LNSIIEPAGFLTVFLPVKPRNINSPVTNQSDLVAKNAASQFQVGYPLFANKTFANRTFAIGERPLHSRQFTLWALANWQESTVLSPIYPLGFRRY
jgi:hypothetical protein